MNYRLLNIFNVSLILLYAGVMIFNYSSLPDVVPAHIGINGKVDDHQAKSFVFRIPFINLLIFFFVEFFRSKPHILNYGTPVTEQNKTSLYSGMQSFLAVTNLVITILFMLISSYLYVRSNGVFLWIVAGLLLLMYIAASLLVKRTRNR